MVETTTKKTQKKPVELLKIAIPAILESIFSVIIISIDTKMISSLGSSAISAVTLSSQPKLLFFSIYIAIGITVSIFVAQLYGKKDNEAASACFQKVLKITILTSVVLGALIALLAYPIMFVCNRQAESLDQSVIYFRIIMGALVFQAVLYIVNAALRGLGKTVLPFISNVCMGVVDIILNYLLIEGHFGFPRLEIAGDAIATVTGTAVACVISLIGLVKKSNFITLKGFFKKKAEKYKELMISFRKKTLNIVAENILQRIGFLLSSIIISLISTDQSAIYSVGMILFSYSMSFSEGFQNAIISLVGRSKGANNKKDIKEYARVGLIIGLITSLIISAVYILIRYWFFSRYFKTEDLINLASMQVWVIIPATICQLLRYVSIGALRGLGEVKAPRRIATICVLLIAPPISYVFAILLNLGLWGIWIGILSSQFVWAVTSVIVSKVKMKKELALMEDTNG